VLPVLTYTDLDEALGRTRALGKPLALYIFSARHATVEHILANTTAGGTVVNATMTHYGNPYLPFGGVGASGMGAYHGEWGFRTFSKEKPVFVQSKLNGLALLYPPYGRTFARMIALLRWIA
jgi:acyl-CoA reductase-like NAD-dependent aldehyde dehydrogenase